MKLWEILVSIILVLFILYLGRDGWKRFGAFNPEQLKTHVYKNGKELKQTSKRNNKKVRK